MITLHGFAYSNYYNIPKHVLLYKGIPFTEDLVYGSGEGYERLNPARKVPSMTTSDGQHIAESSVLCEYLEDMFPEPALLPKDPFARSRVRQIMRCAELYLELPCRRLLPFVFTQQTPPESLCEEVNAMLDKGIASLSEFCSCDPFLIGSEFTMADIYVRYVLSVVDAGAAVLKRDIVSEIDGLKDWRSRLAGDPISKQIDADVEANKEDFFAYIASRN
ncbi:glutathione S-transferase family protein [Congregibacter variabilis]|uniref:Glutathione S-transferase family protein n=1 Tax=Congregibacter variabilis TaxID=3081200 RepID=A0ABZ0I1G4_9GAMM|nr:glutathione S-transferase family protein [Congregibacter sp. IMCC43200]